MEIKQGWIEVSPEESNLEIIDMGERHFRRKKAFITGIAGQDGSVQHLKVLTEEEKEIFKTANEINQIWVVEHAHQRQDFICQSQSVNLFFIPPPATAEQEVHDEYLGYVNNVHWAGANKLKSMYYLRSNAARNTENVNIKIPRIKLEEQECLSCEG